MLGLDFFFLLFSLFLLLALCVGGCSPGNRIGSSIRLLFVNIVWVVDGKLGLHSH